MTTPAEARAGAPIGTRARIGDGGRWPFWSAVAVLGVGLLVTAALTWIAFGLYHSNEKRLLGLRARDVASALTSALPSIQTPLAATAALADATRGDVVRFRRLVAPYVGQGAGRPFVSVSLWRVSDPERGPVAVVGTAPVLSPSTQRTRAYFARASAASGLSVIGLLRSPPLRLGYAFTGTTRGPFAAYGESALPSDGYAPVPKSSAFTDLDYALYLGASTSPQQLLAASVRRLPLRGRRATVKVPFGDKVFTVSVVARGPLGGSLPQRLPWGIAIVGTLLTVGALLFTVRLIKSRAEQRGIALTLQHALLPERLPQLPGLEASARYEAGVQGVEIGGDWYDLIAMDERRLLLVVGDVSGRGLRAATTMASLRFAIHAYAAQGDSPATLLSKLSKLVSVNIDRQLATVLCALVDVQAHEVSVTSAGHLPALLITDQGSEFVDSAVGLPIGVDADASYSTATISAPPGATLLAFTDGLVERRGESIEDGLERLRTQVSSNHVSLDALLTGVLRDLRHDSSQDDTAIAGIRWVS
jgi:hypothetical protein